MMAIAVVIINAIEFYYSVNFYTTKLTEYKN